MSTNETSTAAQASAVAAPGAQVAPDTATSTKKARLKKGAPKSQKRAKTAKPSPKLPKQKTSRPKPIDAKPTAREGTAKAKVLALLQRQGGGTLDEIRKATGWQPHYADVRIMPTCVGNPACGAVIAAMESA